ncbi:MAG: hypothetical protein NXI25_08400 [bacterium]|nr:hypothetical protein [bacterium]
MSTSLQGITPIIVSLPAKQKSYHLPNIPTTCRNRKKLKDSFPQQPRPDRHHHAALETVRMRFKAEFARFSDLDDPDFGDLPGDTFGDADAQYHHPAF